MSDELDEVESAIKKKKAKWRASENPISRLSPEKRKKMLGMKLSEEELQALKEQEVSEDE